MDSHDEVTRVAREVLGDDVAWGEVSECVVRIGVVGGITLKQMEALAKAFGTRDIHADYYPDYDGSIEFIVELRREE